MSIERMLLLPSVDKNWNYLYDAVYPEWRRKELRSHYAQWEVNYSEDA